MKKKKKKILKYTAIFEPADEGGYTVTIPILPGCISEGDSFEEAVENIKNAITCHCASLIKHGEPIPEEPEEEFIGYIEVPLLVPA